MIENLELYSITIGEKKNSLGIAASTVTAIVSATIGLTSSIVGASRARKMQTAMEQKTNNILKVKNYILNMIRAYNSEIFKMVDSNTLSGGLRTYSDFPGIVNDGYGEKAFFFPEGFTGAIRAYNIEFDRQKKLLNSAVEAIKKTEEARQYLTERFKRYGLKPFFSPRNGYAYLVGINDTKSDWNSEAHERWFTVDKNGTLIKRSSTQQRRSDRNNENEKWGMRDRTRKDWEARLSWLQSSGIMSWAFLGYYTNETPDIVGQNQAKKDYWDIDQRVNAINSEVIAEQKNNEVVNIPASTNENRIQNNTTGSKAVQTVRNRATTTAEAKTTIVDKAVTYVKSLTTNEKYVVGGSLLIAGLILTRE